MSSQEKNYVVGYRDSTTIYDDSEQDRYIDTMELRKARKVCRDLPDSGGVIYEVVEVKEVGKPLCEATEAELIAELRSDRF